MDKYAKLARIAADYRRFHEPYNLHEIDAVQNYLVRALAERGSGSVEAMYRKSCKCLTDQSSAVEVETAAVLALGDPLRKGHPKGRVADTVQCNWSLERIVKRSLGPRSIVLDGLAGESRYRIARCREQSLLQRARGRTERIGARPNISAIDAAHWRICFYSESHITGARTLLSEHNRECPSRCILFAVMLSTAYKLP